MILHRPTLLFCLAIAIGSYGYQWCRGALERRLPEDLPVGFRSELILDNLSQPVQVAILPGSSRMLTLQKDGTIFVTDLQATNRLRRDAYLRIPNVDTVGEKGLLSLAFDPDFSKTHFFYVFYHNQVADRARISRFVHLDDGARPEDEVLVWEDHIDLSSQTTPEHLGGLLSFGPDGYLYLGIGDKRDNPADAQDLTKSAGKLIRVDPRGVEKFGPWVRGESNDHLIPQSNPFVDGEGGNLDEVWAIGLRNPFRGGWDPATGTFLISDVGGNVQCGGNASWEDLHEVTTADAGADFGWPVHEGPDCPCKRSRKANHSAPKFSIQHPDARAVMVGPVNTTDLFPPEYGNALFLADYGARWIRYLKLDANGDVTRDTPAGGFEFATTKGRPVSLEFGPDGLYYVENVKARKSPVGVVRRISFARGNQPPSISHLVSDQKPTGEFEASRPAQLDVQFSLQANDPENDLLTVEWDFGDGNRSTRRRVRSGSTIRQAHTYLANGSYFATATVRDLTGSRTSEPLPVVVGVPPVPRIDLPATGSKFRAGDVVTVRGHATDEGVPLPVSSHSWTVSFLHDDHTHPTFTDIEGKPSSENGYSTLELRIPSTGHDFSGDTGYEFRLTVTDDDGLTASQTVMIEPDKSELMFTSNVPGDIDFMIDQVPRRGPFVLDTLIGFEHSISAPVEVWANGHRYVFTGWSTGGSREQAIEVPSRDRTYRANYARTEAVLASSSAER